MKKTTLFPIVIFVIILVSVTLTGCNRQHPKTSSLKVERQHVCINNYEGTYSFDVSVDVPVSGPQQLRDSIMIFLNHELYHAFENVIDTSCNESKLFQSKEVYVKEPYLILDSYSKKYGNSVKKLLSNHYNLNIFLVAQTNSFITYALEWYHCGGSCGSELLCYTFDKKNGHVLDSIVKEKLLRQYLKNLPEKEQPFKDNLVYYDSPKQIFDFALMEKGLLITTNLVNHYQVFLLDYKDVWSYLTPKAQELVETMGDSTQNKWSENFVGDRLGSVKTIDGNTIILTQTPSQQDFIGDFFMDDSKDKYTWTHKGNFSSLRAFNANNGQGFNIIDDRTILYANDDEICTSAPDKRVFSFSQKNNTLYIPINLREAMGFSTYYDRYDIYQFNGTNFVHKGEGCGYWLHPSLQDFTKMVLYGESSQYIVRVDMVETSNENYNSIDETESNNTNCYRYAAWKKNKSTLDAPDLVINNGYYDKQNKCFAFRNNGYEYLVNPDSEYLTILQNGKQQEQILLNNMVYCWRSE